MTNRVAESALLDVLEGSPYGVHSIALDGTILWANPAELALLGYAADEYVGHNVAEFYVDLDGVREILSRLQGGQEVPERHASIRCRNGAVREVLMHTNGRYRDGALVHSRPLGAGEMPGPQPHPSRWRDPDRRLAEILPVGVYTCEAPLGVITYCNEQAVRLWGRAPRIGDTAQRFCGSMKMLVAGTEELLPPEKCPMAIALREGRAFRNEEVIIERPDGSRVFVAVNIDPILDDEGRIVGAINAFHDVTVLKESEKALREAARRKNEFLATLSHELRAPLAPVLASLEIMRLAPGDEVRREDARATIERQTRRLASLVDDLLDVSRITAGKFELRKRPVSLAEIVESALVDLRPAISAAEQTLTLNLPEPIHLNADPGRLIQVLENLLDNATKYTPRGGRITVTASRSASQATIMVQDTGAGIEEGHLTSIFEMFHQARGDHASGDSGLGVGLALARSLVDMHGGSIRAESAGPGSGSTFTVILPATDTPDASPQSEATEREPEGRTISRRRVLIVDDHEAVVDSLSVLIEMLGHQIRSASDGREALAIAAEFRPDIVLMDLGMPTMSGYEAARRIRSESWGADVTLVAMTGWGQEEDKRRSREAGFDHHLVKPARPSDIRRLLAS
jgi:PAS domain S-box-containing protein